MFQLGTFARREPDAEPFAGLVVGEDVAPLAALASGLDVGSLDSFSSVRSLLDDWAMTFERLSAIAERVGPNGAASQLWHEVALPLVDLQTLPPVSPPGQVFCAGANYKRHVADFGIRQLLRDNPEKSEDELRAEEIKRLEPMWAQGRPFVFLGLPTSVVGAYDDVVLPIEGEQHDWELELAVIIGRPARHVSVDDAMEYVAGFTICNDISTRDRLMADRGEGVPVWPDWLAGKCAPTFYPTGPFLTPTAFVADPKDLTITLRLNGEVMQNESTGDMIYDVAALVAHASSAARLLPGDMLLTGSPAGNGVYHQRFLKPGDVMEGEITGLGKQTNTCVAETSGG